MQTEHVVEEGKHWRPCCSHCGTETIVYAKQKQIYRCTKCRKRWEGTELTPEQAREADARVARRATKIVKAITLRQPWAWIVVYCGKDVENRPSHYSHRGPIYIHAAKDMTRKEYGNALVMASEAGVDISAIPTYEKMISNYCGGILGSTNIYDVLPRVNEPERKWHWPRQYGHLLKDTKPIDFLPWKGNQGIWEAEDVFDALEARDVQRSLHDN